MAKASSPVRLDSDLMKAASLAGSALHRSAAEQIEYWADLGRKVARSITPETLLEVQAGLAKLTVEKAQPVTVDPEAVFAALGQKRESGALQEAIASGNIRYQASREHPGFLEEVQPDGTIVVGQFKDGRFEPRQI